MTPAVASVAKTRDFAATNMLFLVIVFTAVFVVFIFVVFIFVFILVVFFITARSRTPARTIGRWSCRAW